MEIYFYTVKPVVPNTELLVWYCREFAERLNYPLTGEMMLEKIRKFLSVNAKFSIATNLYLQTLQVNKNHLVTDPPQSHQKFQAYLPPPQGTTTIVNFLLRQTGHR